MVTVFWGEVLLLLSSDGAAGAGGGEAVGLATGDGARVVVVAGGSEEGAGDTDSIDVGMASGAVVSAGQRR